MKKIISDLNSLPPNLRAIIRRNHAHDYNSPKTLKIAQSRPMAILTLNHTPNLCDIIRRNHEHDYNSPKTLKIGQSRPMASFTLKQTLSKSQKHETFQKLSKLFTKPSFSNLTTKHTISTTPAMRIVSHNQGLSLSHGSFEDLSTTLRQYRRQVTRKETLTKEGHESLKMALNHFC